MKFRLPWFSKKESGEQKSETEEMLRPSMQTRGEPLALGVISAKGGCGKSTISSNSVVLFSALCDRGEGVIGVDMDIINATMTNMMFAMTPDVLREDDGISTLDYLVEGSEHHKLYKLEFPPGKVFSIQVSGRKDVGVGVKDIYILPAKKATISYEKKLSSLAMLRYDEVRDSLSGLYSSIMSFARQKRVRYVVFDFPPLRADQRKVFDGVFTLLEQIPNFIVVSSFDYSAIHGLISLINKRYGYIKNRILAFIVNMSILEETEVVDKIKAYVDMIYGKEKTFFIRSDPRWRVSFIPPIVLDDPGHGAHYDLIKTYIDIGIIDKETVKKKLNIQF